MDAFDAMFVPKFQMTSRLVSNVVDFDAYVDALKPLVKEHLRLTTDQLIAQSATVAQYIKAALAAAELYTQRDIVAHVRTYKVKFNNCYAFRFQHGVGAVLSLKDSADVAVPDAQVTITGDISTGLIVAVSAADFDEYTLVINSGYADDALPPEVIQYALAAVGAFFEIRELAGYTSTVQDADFLPKQLLDPLKLYIAA